MRRFLWATIFMGLTGISGILSGAPGTSTVKTFSPMPNVRPGGIALDTATSIIWVDASAGSDANAGTFASPVKTIKKALTIATDTIAVRPGTYNAALGETFPITVQSGIKLVSTSGAASTIIDATGANSR